jgi:molecular chaperone DnaK
VFQGEENDVWSNELVGLMRVSGLPPGPAGSCLVAVQFELTEEAILRLTAIDEKSGRMLPSEIVFRATPEELRARLAAIVVESPPDEEPRPPRHASTTSAPTAPANAPAATASAATASAASANAPVLGAPSGLVGWLKRLAAR